MALAKFTTDGILDAAAEEVRNHGSAVRIASIAARVGAPTGSIYHRFGSREELLVHLWLRSVRRFHEVYLAAGRSEDPEKALLGMAESVVTFTRDHPQDAASMALFRQKRLVENTPDSCREAVAHINDEIHERLSELAQLRYGRVTEKRRQLVRIAAADGPYGFVRPYLWDSVPEWLPAVVVASSTAVLALGD